MKDDFLSEFRSLTFERLDRLRAALRDDAGDPDRGLVGRELHTLRGEAQLMGFKGMVRLVQDLERCFATRDEGWRPRMLEGLELCKMLAENGPSHRSAEVDTFIERTRS